uniref:PR domain zinc finger protein 10 n=1 Tax=Esox lucius TaxID=8010 RepID=A0A6Q2X6A9_ESOLU
METKQESSPVWNQAGNSESGNGTQVHFEGGAVTQVVYSGDQQDRGQQQVVYAPHGNPYAAVESAEHTLVYIHPADGATGVFSDQPQVAYIQQDGTTQQSSLGIGSTSFAHLDLGCEECNFSNPSVCEKHGALHPIPNRPVVSRARASLPLVLYIDRFLGGVFSKRRIPKRTQFGPVEGPLVRQTELQDHYIHLKLCMLDADKDVEKSDDMWLDLSDEDSCNWMMFVRPAQNHLEQNLVAYQYGSEIFYTTIKNIQPKQELKVWYAASYAEFVSQKVHDVTEEERKVLREQEKNWPCYECNRRFMSSEQLQQHLNMHDDKLEYVTRPKGRARGRGRKRFGTGRRPGRPPKFIRLDPPVDTPLDKTPVGPPLWLRPWSPRCTTMSGNAALQHLFIRKSFRPFKCTHCGKAFRDKDKLEIHLRVHGRDAYLSCNHCNKGFLSHGALEDHLLLHSEHRAYSCLFCTSTFDRLDLLKEHVGVHAVDGCFSCPSCKKIFTDFKQVKKHVRSFHSEKIFQCSDCDKAFCRPDKLRLHMLRHSDRKDFLCSTCGKQFKRKDKLREHMQRMHNPEREAKKADRIHRTKVLKQKVPTTDFESFVFKCRMCMMGFRRRGMLVNHLSKRHPEMRIEEVPELTLPIIKPNRDYFCQYCDKVQLSACLPVCLPTCPSVCLSVYKSASKRKAHILKNHPGAELPPSIRKLRPAVPGEPDPMLSTHTQLTGTIATAPVCCPHCAKQYSSKTKMVQHIRKKHPEYAQLANTIQAPLATAVISSTPADGTTSETVVTTDLLTQAMTELSHTLTTDYQRIQYIPVSQSGGGINQPQHIQLQVVQVQPAGSPHSQHSTLDVSQLHDTHGYSQHAIQVQHIQVSETGQITQGQPLSPSSQATQELSPAQLTPVTLAQSQALQTSNQQGSVQHAYIPGNWNYRGYRESASEIQMMALPHAQYVIAEAGTPVAGINSGGVKTTHYVISEGQAELDSKGASIPQSSAQTHPDHLDSQTSTQYIITTTTNSTGTSEVHISKP